MKKNNIEKKLFNIFKIDFENFPTKEDFNSKVDKEEGKGLSTNDFSDFYKNKVINSIDLNNVFGEGDIEITKDADNKKITIKAKSSVSQDDIDSIKTLIDNLSKKTGDVVSLTDLVALNTDTSKDEIDLIQSYISENPHDIELIIDKSFSTSKQIDLSNCYNVKITGYKGNIITYNPDNLDNLFKIDNSHDISFNNLTCNSNNDNAILIGNQNLAYNIVIRDCRINDCHSMIMTHKIHDVTVENNFCYNSKGSSFAFLNDPYNLMVNNNVVEKGVNVQIKVYSTFGNTGHISENVTITNNRICDVTQGTGEWDMAIGIEINENSYNCVISNNILTRCADMGISISGAHKVTCNGNVIEGTNNIGYGTGIEIVACDDFVCNSNFITGISKNGIILDKTYEGVVSSNNIVMIKSGWDPEDYCIVIGGEASPKNCHDLVISNNKLKFGTYGIRFNENLENIKIIGNLFEDIFYKDIAHDSPSVEILKTNITIEGNTFDTSIDIGKSQNIFINANVFNLPNDEEGNRPYISAVFVRDNSKYITISNNIINNACFIVNFEKVEEVHIKSTGIRIINNIIDYNSLFIKNDDGLLVSDYLLKGNIDSSYLEPTETPLNTELFDVSKLIKNSDSMTINYDESIPNKVSITSSNSWDYALLEMQLSAGKYKFIFTSDDTNINPEYCIPGQDGVSLTTRGTEGNIFTLTENNYKFMLFVNPSEVSEAKTTIYDNLSLIRIE